MIILGHLGSMRKMLENNSGICGDKSNIFREQSAENHHGGSHKSHIFSPTVSYSRLAWISLPKLASLSG